MTHDHDLEAQEEAKVDCMCHHCTYLCFDQRSFAVTICSKNQNHGLRAPNEGIDKRNLKIWEWELISGLAMKTISSPGVRSPWVTVCLFFINFCQKPD